MAEQRPWHQYFGLSWADLFHGSAFGVDAEKDLSHKQQLLDLLVTRPDGAALPEPMPDGFGDLARYTLITFKSYQEALDGWALSELVGHYVNLRKQLSPTMRELLPEADFRLIAVCARHPDALARQVALEQQGQGVFRVRYFGGEVRVVVVARLPREPRNAMLHLFSADEGLVEYGAAHFRPRSPETSSLLSRLVARYRTEGLAVPETLQEFAARARREMALEMSQTEIALIPVEKRLAGIPVEQRLGGLTDEELKNLPPDLVARFLRLHTPPKAE